MIENRKRSIIKTATWRIIGIITTMIIVYFATNSTTTAVSIGLVDLFVKTYVYYLHERVWNSIDWGREIEEEEENKAE